jgi:hypothetical protein
MALAGVKKPRARVARPSAAEQPEAQMTDDERDVLSGLPQRPLPKRLSPEEYLAMRAAERE